MNHSRGITLVEMLVALAVTLLMMGAVISVFGFIGEHVTDSRSIIETNDRLRSAAHRLREDLTNITVETVPWQRPEAGAGYLEILEGFDRDYPRDNSGGIDNAKAMTPLATRGDWDDVMMFTIRSKGDPYRGTFGGGPIESNTAEVVWYCRPGQAYPINNVLVLQTYVLCRRQLLIVPQAALDGAIASLPAAERQRMSRVWFYNRFDVSARVENLNGSRIANTLGDLTKRENRFAHNRWNQSGNLAYPFLASVDPPNASSNTVNIYPHVREDFAVRGREGEEVVLTNVLAFDVQVFDPTVTVRYDGQTPVVPGEPGYANGTTSASAPAGAYIDLGENVAGATFGRIPQASAAERKSMLLPAAYQQQRQYSTYDTWSFHYEQDGIRQPTNLAPEMPANWTAPDPGTNGLDDNPTTNPGVDDMGERETSPPYPYPLRGLRVKIRVYEPSSKQVRETTIVQSFVPE